MWTPQTPSLSLQDLNDRLVVIHFWATWNSYDRQLDAIIAALKPEFQNQITFRSLDIDLREFWPISADSAVMNVPALGLFVNGKHTDTQIGLRDKRFWRSILSLWSRLQSEG